MTENSRHSYLCRVWALGQGKSFRATLIRGGAGSLAVKSANLVLSFLLAITLARTLGADGYGVYAFAMALVSLLAIPVQVGIPQVVLRETANAAVREDWGLMRGLWRWATRAALIFSAVMLVLGLTAIWVYRADMDVTTATTLAIAFLLVPMLALGNLRSAALRGLQRVVLGQLPEAVIRPGGLFLLVTLWAMLSSSPLTPPVAMALNFAIVGVAFLFGAWILRSARPSGLVAKPEPESEPTFWRRAAIPLALAGGLQLINGQTDIIVLGVFRPSEDVGVYRVTVQVAALVTFGLMAINQVIAPHISRLYTSGDLQKLQRLVTNAVVATSLLATVPAIALIFFADEILGAVFGDAFSVGAFALTVLVFGQLANAVMGPVAMVLNMTGHERSTLKGVGVAAALNVCLNIILIPQLGMDGAALSTAISLSAWNLLLAFSLKRDTGIRIGPLVLMGKK